MAEATRGRPRQTHCKRGHPLTPESTRASVRGKDVIRYCLEGTRSYNRDRNRELRREYRVIRVAAHFGCSLEEARGKVAQGVDLRRFNAFPRQAYANQPRNRPPGARLVCCGLPVDPAAGKYGCANCHGDQGPARWRA